MERRFFEYPSSNQVAVGNISPEADFAILRQHGGVAQVVRAWDS